MTRHRSSGDIAADALAASLPATCRDAAMIVDLVSERVFGLAPDGASDGP